MIALANNTKSIPIFDFQGHIFKVKGQL